MSRGRRAAGNGHARDGPPEHPADDEDGSGHGDDNEGAVNDDDAGAIEGARGRRGRGGSGGPAAVAGGLHAAVQALLPERLEESELKALAREAPVRHAAQKAAQMARFRCAAVC